MVLCWQSVVSVFNMLSRLVIAFLPRSKHILSSWLQSSAVIQEPQNIKSVTVSIVYPSICHEAMGPDAMILVFWRLSFKPTFSSLLFQFHALEKEMATYSSVLAGENPMDRGAWQAAVHGVTKNPTELNNWVGMHAYSYLWEETPPV